MNNHATLKIVRGIPKVPASAASAIEPGVEDEVDLLDPLGFSINPLDGYIMQRPEVKSGGIWADNPNATGRIPIGGGDGNVIETIDATIHFGTIAQLSALQSKLEKMAEGVDSYFFNNPYANISPVYLVHQFSCEPGARYALIYRMEIAYPDSVQPDDDTRFVSITVERDAYWQAHVPPGGNPKLWTIEVNNRPVNASTALLAGLGATYSNDNLVIQDIQNRREWNVGQTATVSQNYIDVPAELVPGDVPALACVSVSGGEGSNVLCNTLIMGVSSKTPSVVDGGVAKHAVYTLNAGDATALTDTSLAADTGAPFSDNLAAGRRSVTTFATATMQDRLLWSSAETSIYFSMMRGVYRVFMRARLSAANTTVNARLAFNIGYNYPQNFLAPQTITDQGAGGTGNTTQWGIFDMGQVALPYDEQVTVQGLSGYGAALLSAGANSAANIIYLQAERTAGAGSLYVSDLIFIPVDEASALASLQFTSFGTVGFTIVDTSRYFLRGKPGVYAIHAEANSLYMETPELRGNGLFLRPNVNNRIVFLSYLSGATPRSEIAINMKVRVDIIPRWVGMRTV